MDQRDRPDAINDRAAAWVARIDAAPLDADTQAELDAWVARDDRHRGALLRAQAAWRLLDSASGAHALSGPQSAIAEPMARSGDNDEDHRIGRRRVLWGAVAASLVVAGVGWRTIATQPERIQTAVGEIRRVPLADGSGAVINTNTRLEVDFTQSERKVRLGSGEAWFEVAKDPNRPFVVAAGGIRVRAVGTAFSVRRFADGVDVQVTEGKVEVWSIDRDQARRFVGAGTRTFASDLEGPRAPVRDESGIDRKLAWRDGALNFEGDTLGAAVAEFNRYNRVTLEVDPALADEKIVGRFHINEPDEFARAASTTLDARIVRGRDTIRIARQ